MSFESMPRQDLLLAIDSLAAEKMIDKEKVEHQVLTNVKLVERDSVICLK